MWYTFFQESGGVFGGIFKKSPKPYAARRGSQVRVVRLTCLTFTCLTFTWDDKWGCWHFLCPLQDDLSAPDELSGSTEVCSSCFLHPQPRTPTITVNHVIINLVFCFLRRKEESWVVCSKRKVPSLSLRWDGSFKVKGYTGLHFALCSQVSPAHVSAPWLFIYLLIYLIFSKSSYDLILLTW